MSIQLIPAVIPYDHDLVKKQFEDIRAFSSALQLDISDGDFTPKATLQASDFSDEIFFGLAVELHAMVSKPFSLLDAWISLGVKRMVIHAETSPSAQDLQSLIAKGITPVLGLKATTPISVLEPYVHLVSSYLFLTIDPPGHQGGALIPDALNKVKKFREQYPAFEITVDGGANAQTLQVIATAGVNRIIVGSALQENGYFSEKKYALLQSIIKQ